MSKSTMIPIVSAKNLEGVLLVRMNRGVINALDLELVSELGKAVEKARTDPAVKAVVLTGTNDKFFCIGLDLPQLVNQDRRYIGKFYDAFGGLCLAMKGLPKPIVAAVNGHAVGGGCVLALAGDKRIVSSGRCLMGFNAVKLGVPTPHIGRTMLEATVERKYAQTLLSKGEFYMPRDAKAMGLADHIVMPRGLLVSALKTANSLASDGKAFSAKKVAAARRLAASLKKDGKEEKAEFIDRWFSPEAQALLHAALKKF